MERQLDDFEDDFVEVPEESTDIAIPPDLLEEPIEFSDKELREPKEPKERKEKKEPPIDIIEPVKPKWVYPGEEGQRDDWDEEDEDNALPTPNELSGFTRKEEPKKFRQVDNPLEKRRQAFMGCIGFKQGFMYVCFKYPYTHQFDVAWFSIAPKGFIEFKNADIVYRTIEKMTGKPFPKRLMIKTGVHNEPVSRSVKRKHKHNITSVRKTKSNSLRTLK